MHIDSLQFHRDKIFFVPLGGTEQIGMNLNAYGYEGKWIIVDFGIGFANDKLPGIDIILPDTSFLKDKKKDILGLFLTHAHEDHFGAIPYIWEQLQCPIYATPLTANLLEAKLEAKHENDIHNIPICTIDLCATLQIESFFIQYIAINHSIPESNAILIKTKAGNIFHTGDWKIDTDPVIGKAMEKSFFETISEDGILAMVCDSTNVFEKGSSLSESVVAENIKNKICTQKKGKIFVTCFASNVARIESILHAAKCANRKVILQGRAFQRVLSAAQKAGYLQSELPDFILDTDACRYRQDEILVLATGSQGEYRAALPRIARAEHPHLRIDKDDVVYFSSRIIPGNDHEVFWLYNQITATGALIIEDDHDIHASGHACYDELAALYEWIKPMIAIPVHGEQRHLHQHAKLAHDFHVPYSMIPHNGAIISLQKNTKPLIVGTVDVKTHVKDGNDYFPYDDKVIKDRRFLAREGIVVINITYNPKKDIYDCDFHIFGVYFSEQRFTDIKEIIDEILDDSMIDHYEEEIRISVRRYLKQETQKKPKIVVFFHA